MTKEEIIKMAKQAGFEEHQAKVAHQAYLVAKRQMHKGATL